MVRSMPGVIQKPWQPGNGGIQNKETTLKSVGISYLSAVQKKIGGLIFVGYINTLNLTEILGLFCREFFVEH